MVETTTIMTYRVSIREDEANSSILNTYTMSFTDDDLVAVALMLTAMLGIDRDQIVTITDLRGNKQDLDDLIIDSENVLLRDDQAEDLESDDETEWLEHVREVADDADEDIEIEMKYTIKIEGEQSYLVQFDRPEFLIGCFEACYWFGQDPKAFLKHYHEGDDELPLPEVTPTSGEPEIEFVLATAN